MNQNGKQPLVEIQRMLKANRQKLIEAADTIRAQDVSNYPIFVASKIDVEIGIPLLRRGELADDWAVNASTLEEFHARRIIEIEKIDDFRKLYRTHGDEICFFVLDTDPDESEHMHGGAKFIFIR